MVKKEVDPLLEPVLDKIESFDPERADRLRENNTTRRVLEVTAEGPKVTTVTVPDVTVAKPVPVKPKPKPSGRNDYKICTHCGKKGAYLDDKLSIRGAVKEFCKYCRPKKKWKNIPEGLLEPAAEPKKKSWLARLFRL